MESTKELALTDQAETPKNLIALGIEKGIGIEELGKLMEMQERWEARQAKKAYLEAFTKFQSNVPEIRKTKAVRYKETDVKPTYLYATLADIVRQLRDVLEQNGLTYRWEIQDDLKESIKVTCIVSHREGHSEKTTMSGSPDGSGGKNAIQARGSAIEYMKRYTLIGALGLATTDTDSDGRNPDDRSVDDLHKEYMATYNDLILLRPDVASKYLPDNWKGERNAVNYKKAIGDIRRMLHEAQQKAK